MYKGLEKAWKSTFDVIPILSVVLLQLVEMDSCLL